MSDPVLIALIAAIPSTVFGIAILLQGIRTHRTFNSKMDKMQELIREAAYAKGRKDERESE